MQRCCVARDRRTDSTVKLAPHSHARITLADHSLVVVVVVVGGGGIVVVAVVCGSGGRHLRRNSTKRPRKTSTRTSLWEN